MTPEPEVSPRLRVALAETEPIRAQGFRTLFEKHPSIELVGLSVAQLLGDRHFQLALVSIHEEELLPTLIGTIRGIRPKLRILVMGLAPTDEAVVAAISAGARAYLEMNATQQEVEQAIHAVNEGAIWAPRRLLALFDETPHPKQSQTRSAPEKPMVFTERERDVLKLLVAARSNREIARKLGIRERTVKDHVARLMQKVGVENRVALSVHVITHSVLDRGPK